MRPRVNENRQRFFSPLGIPVDALAIPRQVHSANVARVGAAGAVAETDALVTNTPGVYLCVTVADCVPILIHDPEHRAVAAVHAGWRGSAAGILSLALKLMRSAFGTRPGDLRAYVGPAAGGCCYEVGPDVAERFPPKYLADHQGSLRLDLKAFQCRLTAGGRSPSLSYRSKPPLYDHRIPSFALLPPGRPPVGQDDGRHRNSPPGFVKYRESFRFVDFRCGFA